MMGRCTLISLIEKEKKARFPHCHNCDNFSNNIFHRHYRQFGDLPNAMICGDYEPKCAKCRLKGWGLPNRLCPKSCVYNR